MAKHLYLIGYRGSGKSSVGIRLGEILNMPVVDSDDYVEERARRPIRNLFAEEGEEYFRELEAAAVHEIAARTEPCVVSLGGGAILRPSNRKLLRSSGRVVWLQASVEELEERIASDIRTAERRPALTSLGLREEIERVLKFREPLYREAADWVVSTGKRSIDDIASEIVSWYSGVDS